MLRTILVGVMLVLVLALATPAGATEPRPPGGCAAFGANVATLATTLGADFGAAASLVATTAPQAFPTTVVFPEQAQLCAGR